VIGVLLIFEVIGLVLLGGYEFLQVDWRGINLRTPQHQAVEVAVFALFVPSAILTLLSALSFLFLHRRGWLLAAIAQGLSLAVCLWLYSLFQPSYVYPIMAYCILMILYLNSQDVRMVFRPGQSQRASHEN
jgi:small-conductance mechanosensitive channel